MMKKEIEKNCKAALQILTPQDNGKLLAHLNACVHCGLCDTSCHFYLATRAPKHVPGYKVNLVAALYKQYATVAGKMFPGLFTKKRLDEKTFAEMTEVLFGGCTMCGRCVSHCSVGVDIPFVVRTGRKMLAAMGYVPQSLQNTLDTALRTGNNMAIPEPEFMDTIEWMSEELQDEDPEGQTPVSIPVNIENQEFLYTLNPREVKYFPLSIAAAAKIFREAGISWTLSSKMYDLTNYGYFACDDAAAKIIAMKMYDETRRLHARVLVSGECGHGSRVLRWEAPNYAKQNPDFSVTTMIELLDQFLKEEKITVDKTLNQGTYTIHDPCNITRNGGLFHTLRSVVKQVVPNLIEMTPHGTDNFCCGGGGGLLAMSEYKDNRLKAGQQKANQIKKTGAQVVITPCHNCADQLSQLNQTYNLGIQIKSVTELVAHALVKKGKM
jgi:Fe-S oxidoreductase